MRQAVELEPSEPDWQATLGAVLEAAGKLREAAAAFNRAVAIDPRSEWRDKATSLRTRADLAALPPEFSRIGSAPTVTRGDVAAAIGINLPTLVARAPQRITDIATDVRTHWAAPWILPVTRAGIMSIYPNHTFQPGASVRRTDLATMLVELLRLSRAPELANWQAARPRFADVPATSGAYRTAAIAVAAGILAPTAEARFEPGRAASGAELMVAIDRIKQLAK